MGWTRSQWSAEVGGATEAEPPPNRLAPRGREATLTTTSKVRQKVQLTFAPKDSSFPVSKMSFLTDDEIASLRIRQMIVHVVGGKDEFEPQPVMEGVEHIDFFLTRIQD